MTHIAHTLEKNAKLIRQRKRERSDFRKEAENIRGRSKEDLKDKRISVCVPCKRGIFTHQPKKWTKEGWIHTGCDPNENTNDEGTLL
jgi:hypothetical protein